MPRVGAFRLVPVVWMRFCGSCRLVPVRAKIRLRVTHCVSLCVCVCVCHACRVCVCRDVCTSLCCLCVCLCVSCVSFVTRAACHAYQKYCGSCLSRVMCVWTGCGSVRVSVIRSRPAACHACLDRVCGSWLFLRALVILCCSCGFSGAWCRVCAHAMHRCPLFFNSRPFRNKSKQKKGPGVLEEVLFNGDTI
jgi:hypothetical protein